MTSTPQKYDVEVICNKDLTLNGLSTCFQRAGPIIAIEVVSETLTTQTVILSFQHEEQAKIAEHEKDLWLLETLLQNDASEIDENDTYPQPRIKSEIHVVSHHSKTPQIDECRVFCQLPWTSRKMAPRDKNQAEKLVDETFFQHFAQFGPMEYCYTVKDRGDKLSHGFVRYFSSSDALRALHLSKRCYRARRGLQQYSITNQLLEIIHIPCGRTIDRRNRRLHDVTCQRQRSFINKGILGLSLNLTL